MVQEEINEQDNKRSEDDDPENDGKFSDRNDPANVQQGAGPDDDQANGDLVSSGFRKKESEVFHKKNRINGKVHKGVQPGPPAFIPAEAKSQRMLHPLIIAAGHWHHAVEL